MPVHWTGEAIASDWAADRGVDEVRGVLAGELFEPTAGRRGHVRATTRELNDIRITETTTTTTASPLGLGGPGVTATEGQGQGRGQGQGLLNRDYNAKQHVDIKTMALCGS